MNYLRNKRQQEFANIWLKSKYGILYLCPRFGKIKTTINCLQAFDRPKILIIHPIETIKKSWEDDFVYWGYVCDVTYCTTASLWKLAENPKLFDVVIMDEVQMFSPANLQEMKKLIAAGNKNVLGLSGTISSQTASELSQTLNMPILAEYPIEQAIKEKVITDYKIHVVMTDLDNKEKYIVPSKKHPDFKVTEKNNYEYLTSRMEEIKQEVKDNNEKMVERMAAKGLMPDFEDFEKVDLGMLPLQRMAILKKSIAKRKTTLGVMERFKGDRMLIFCGTTAIADSLGVPVYHSKDKDKEVKDAFCRGEGDILATVDMFEAGVTIKPISRAIINSFDSNPENLAQRVSRLTGFEYDSPDKVAMIYIICTDTIEKDWLLKALEFFDLEKVSYHYLKKQA